MIDKKLDLRDSHQYADSLPSIPLLIIPMNRDDLIDRKNHNRYGDEFGAGILFCIYICDINAFESRNGNVA